MAWTFRRYEREGDKYTIFDGVQTYTAGGDDDTAREVAQAFARCCQAESSDWGDPREYVVARIDNIVFAFDGLGAFEFPTDRELITY